MNNIIFCFSGTGNSLYVAKKIQKNIDDTIIKLIPNMMNNELINLPYDTVGIICPAYYGSLPPIVEDFIKKLAFEKNQYIYTVITAGARHGNSFNEINYLIEKQGGKLKATFSVCLPGNYIAMYGAWPKFVQDFEFKNSEKKIIYIINSIKSRQLTNNKLSIENAPKALTSKIKNYHAFSKDYYVTDKCTSCGICKKVCPTDNVCIVQSKVSFENNCERCMACIQWCPQNAIVYKGFYIGTTAKRKRYTNPNIKVSEMFTKMK